MLRSPLFLSLLLTICIGSLVQQCHSKFQSLNESKRDEFRNTQQHTIPSPEIDVRKAVANISIFKFSNSREKSNPLTTGAFLANNQECKADIQKYCTKGSSTVIPNLKVLQCIDDLDNAPELINPDCQSIIYMFKYNMTHDAYFDDAAMRFCQKDIKHLDECNEHTDERGTGRLVSCLYDRLTNITEPTCRNYINQLQSVIFTDWRLSEYFVRACEDDIVKHECGRLDDEKNKLPHNQGGVVSCLSKLHRLLSKQCLKHISRLHEMQSNDYHLDRALYYACRDDRERFCAQTLSGNGRVYRCLYEHKLDTLMSPACRKEVHRRQKMVTTNALLDAPLIKACASEMSEHQCVTEPNDPDSQLSLVNLLLCLEDRIRKGNAIKDECRREMLIHRRMLMSDYAISPEIISKCEPEMIQHCSLLYQKGLVGSIEQRGGRMQHCLLNAARREKNFSLDCLSTIKSLIRAVNPGSDIRTDPLLETTCRPVIDTLCARLKPGDSNIIMCLLNNLKHVRMTEECEDRLMEVAYFMARDWRLTPRLFLACRQNFLGMCKMSKQWSINSNMSDVEVGQYLSCLHRQKKLLNPECRSELQQIMRIRTASIGLMPEIEENCIRDLATCQNPETKGEEMKCLQKNYKNLEEQCKSAVQSYTKMTIADPTLNFPLMKACEPMIQLYCSNIGSGNENELVRCLIKYKNNQKMDFRCKANIEHHQMISLKDQAFLSEQFRKNCDSEISEHCATKKTKASIVQCLANLVLLDTVDKMTRISVNCRQELKLELLQRSESINLDPVLGKACRKDIQKFCSSRPAGNAQIIDCLKANHNQVSLVCHAILKRREKIDIVLPSADYSLTSKCASSIQKYCTSENQQNLLSCLRRNINQENMPNTCRTVLLHRLMILNSDARFNKGLIENCQVDIDKYCRHEILNDDKDGDESNDDDDNDDGNNNMESGEVQDRDMGGRIIGCLRLKYANTQTDLEPKCVTELIDVIQTSKLDIQLDVKLYQKCRKIIQEHCTGLEKEDCLKLRYQKKLLNDEACASEVVRIIKEGQADIHVDSSLSAACQLDILKYCNDIPIGSGKQLQCLLKIKKTVSQTCQKVLFKRLELWKSVSHVDDIDDLARQIVNSSNHVYLWAMILTLLFGIFLIGCICRPCIRNRRLQKYK